MATLDRLTAPNTGMNLGYDLEASAKAVSRHRKKGANFNSSSNSGTEGYRNSKAS